MPEQSKKNASEITIGAETKGKKRKKWTAEIIIQKSKKMFYEKGFELSMHDIARELDTKPSSLYRHIENKRELWFAITNEDFTIFQTGIGNLIQNNSGTSVEMLKKVGKYFIDFACEDFNRFQLMFLYEPPKTKNPGKYEQECNPDSITELVKLCNYVILENQLKEVTPEHLAMQMISIVLGFSVLLSPINEYLLEKKNFKHIRDENYINTMLNTSVDGIINNYK